MAASTFDALDASRKLKQAGIEQQHAEAIADQLRAAAGADLNKLATKADLKTLATAEQFSTLAAELRIVKWAMAFQGAVSLATLAAVLGLAWKLVP